MEKDPLVFRRTLEQADLDRIRAISASTGAFHEFEIDVAVDLASYALSDGQEKSGYHFLFAEREGRVIGYACYGPIPCTKKSFDLFWIAVSADCAGRGVGRSMMERVEAAIGAMKKSARIYIETSRKDSYRSTREFYRKLGYREEACLEDFYDDGDDKVIFVKQIT
jgi:ribosomal protein S18 acetylase RimI-like enzyme